jgi:hypothetical protein
MVRKLSQAVNAWNPGKDLQEEALNFFEREFIILFEWRLQKLCIVFNHQLAKLVVSFHGHLVILIAFEEKIFFSFAGV